MKQFLLTTIGKFSSEYNPHLSFGTIHHIPNPTDELDIQNQQHRVVWYKANRTIIYKTYQFQSQVLDAVFSTFKRTPLPYAGSASSRSENYLCILTLSEGLYIYAPTGPIYQVALPFKPRSLHNLQTGVLIQRHVAQSAVEQNELHPILFSLFHPLEEIRPVALAPTSSLASEFFMDTNEAVCFSAPKENLVVSYHRVKQMYTLWKLDLNDRSDDTTIQSTSSSLLRTKQKSDESSFLTSSIFLNDSTFMTSEINHPITAEVLLRKVWEIHIPTTMPSKLQKQSHGTCFFSLDPERKQILCIFDEFSNQLLIQSIADPSSSNPVGPTTMIPCQKAIPINVSAGCYAETPTYSSEIMMLLLTGELVLHRAEHRICAWVPSTCGVKSICNSICNQFDIILKENPTSRLRVCTNMIPESEVLCKFLSCLEQAVPFELAIALQADICFQLQTMASEPLHCGDNVEWMAVLNVFQYCVTDSVDIQEQPIATDEWEDLLSSAFHQMQTPSFEVENSSYSQSTPPLQKMAYQVNKAEFQRHLNHIFKILHLIYEDYKLNASATMMLLRISKLLVSLAPAFENRGELVDYYTRDIVAVQTWVCPFQIAKPWLLTPFESSWIPNVYEWLTNVMQPNSNVTVFPRLKGLEMTTTEMICEFYALLFNPSGSFEENAHEVVRKMTQVKFKKMDLERLPFGIALVLHQALQCCRVDPSFNMGAFEYALIGRADLAKAKRMAEAVRTKQTPCQVIEANPLHSLSQELPLKKLIVNDADGLNLVEELSSMRFGRDRRMREVCRLVRSSRPLFLRVDQRPEMSDHEYLREQQARLFLLCVRSVALGVARGMVTLSTFSPQLTEALEIPEINLSGRIPPANAALKLDPSAAGTTVEEFTHWPEFHNGVAAGLRILTSPNAKITRTWIIYNKPEEPNFSHGGFLMGVGLQGYLSALAMPDIFDYLSQGHDAITVGILLGMAASKRGTMDRSVSKMLCLHLPSLLPPSFAEIEVASISQSAAILGVGLLYQTSAHRLMTEFLLSEIGRRSPNDRYEARENYILSAGMALGLVLLGCGSNTKHQGLSDLNIEDRLQKYIVGGRDPEAEANKKHFDPAKCSRIREGENVNIQVTCPGSILALCLMYLKSNNHAIADRLSVPDTLFLLDYVRPDMMLLRVLCRNLILWDEILPTTEWTQQQIPAVISRCFHENPEASTLFQRNSNGESSEKYDREAINQAHAYILAGACLALGLRFASTANAAAYKVIHNIIKQFQAFRDSAPATKHQKPNRSTLETCIAVACQALALVMAGTGEIAALRLFREIRQKVDSDITYGTHMALNMAIGFLFLSGGQAALTRSNESIASLLIALYPSYPKNPADNFYHLQPLRHFYVLATEARCVKSIDVKTKEQCYLPLEITLKVAPESPIRVIAPCLLPEYDEIYSIRINSPRYYPLTIEFTTENDFRTLLETQHLIYVQRKKGYLSYQSDPHGINSIFSKPFPPHVHGSVQDRADLLQLLDQYNEDPTLVRFGEYFCDGEKQEDLQEEGWFGTCILYEALTHDKPASLAIYLAIYRLVRDVAMQRTTIGLANFRLVIDFHHHFMRKARTAPGFLLDTGFVLSSSNQLEQYFFSLGLQHELEKYFESPTSGTPELYQCLKFFGFPSLGRFQEVRELSHGTLELTNALQVGPYFASQTGLLTLLMTMEEGDYY